MASVAASFERHTDSSMSGGVNASIVGGVTAPPAEPIDAMAALVRITRDRLIVTLVDGRVIIVPLDWFPRLIEASPRERRNYQLIGNGALIHWPDVDEDIDVPNLLRA
jgi:Protein of unknown function (DUF2442)